MKLSHLLTVIPAGEPVKVITYHYQEYLDDSGVIPSDKIPEEWDDLEVSSVYKGLGNYIVIYCVEEM